jgi:O-antigen/teichoic acid export membrane protein
MVVGTALAVGFSLLLLLLSFFIDSMFASNIGALLFTLSPLVVVFPIQAMLVAALQGTNSIGRLSAYTVLPRLLYLISILVVVRYFSLTLLLTLVLNVLTLIIATILIVWAERPIFTRWRDQLTRLVTETKKYGLHVYTGKLVDNLTFGSDKILISYFLSTTAVGLYSVGQTLTMPISLMSRSLATSVFKDFTSYERIPWKLSTGNFLWLVAAGGSLFLLGEFLLVKIFTVKYFEALAVVPLLTVAAIFIGLNQLYNSFLMAHGRGQYVRNMSITTSSLNVIGNIVLIREYGLKGAALSSILTYVLNYVMNIYYYQKTVGVLLAART